MYYYKLHELRRRALSYFPFLIEFLHVCMCADQTCDNASCPFVRTHTLQDQTQLCPQLFEIPEHTLPRNIAFTNQYYGGDKAQTKHVLYINGRRKKSLIT